MSRLVDLISVLMSATSTRQQFNDNPKAVLDLFDIPQDARQALYTMDATTIAAFLKAEMVEFDDWDVPAPTDPDCNVPEAPQAEWPAPVPKLFKISPSSGSATVSVVVKGEGILYGAPLTLEKGTSKITATSPQYSGTFRCAHIDASVNLTGASGGQYHVVVTNSSGQVLRLDNAFTVNA
jgi:hypothetical protein